MAAATERCQLVERYLDDVTTPEEVTELSGLLERDPETAAYFAQASQFYLLLRDFETSHFDRARSGSQVKVAGQPRRRFVTRTTSRPYVRAVFAAAAALALMLGAWLIFQGIQEKSAANTVAVRPPTPPPAVITPAPAPQSVIAARIERLAGTVTFVKQGATNSAAHIGQELASGDGLHAESAGEATLVCADGTRIELRSGASIACQLVEHGLRVDLTTGALAATVAKQPAGKELAFVTPQARARVLGTRLTLAVADNATRIEVSEGHVEFTRLADQRRVEVPAGSFAVAAVGAALEPQAIVQEVVIVIEAGARQTFAGIGIGQAGASLLTLDATRKQEIEGLLFRGLKLQALRLRFDVRGSMERFIAETVTSGLIRDALAVGVATVILAPTHVNQADKRPDLAMVAAMVKLLWETHGLQVTVAGIESSPDGWSGPDLIEAIAILRAQLNSRGLHDVKILAEAPAADAHWLAIFQALKRDAAWRTIDGIAVHAIAPEAADGWAELMRGTGKDYWVTEAGLPPGTEALDDNARAALLAQRFLGDLNQGVGRWMWAFGAAGDGADGSTPRLIALQGHPPGSRALAPYHALKQLTQAFDVGAVFRHVSITNPPPATPQTALTVAAAVEPDGGWVIGVVHHDVTAAAPAEPASRPPYPYRVEIRVPELAHAGTIDFALTRSGGAAAEGGQTVRMVDGVASVTVQPLELVTLRSHPGVGK
jgi:ferric-dicitrate binding protein FerR (iron transport regulator)